MRALTEIEAQQAPTWASDYIIRLNNTVKYICNETKHFQNGINGKKLSFGGAIYRNSLPINKRQSYE
jgi:hypothetical protein